MVGTSLRPPVVNSSLLALHLEYRELQMATLHLLNRVLCPSDSALLFWYGLHVCYMGFSALYSGRYLRINIIALQRLSSTDRGLLCHSAG